MIEGTPGTPWLSQIGNQIFAEVAEFTIAPRFAYDDLGAPPLVPPDATLIFEVELVDFENKSDVLGDGRGILRLRFCFGFRKSQEVKKHSKHQMFSLHKIVAHQLRCHQDHHRERWKDQAAKRPRCCLLAI